MAGHVETARVAIEMPGVAVDPGDRVAHLLGHRHQAAARLLDADEVEHDVVRAGGDQHLGREREVLCPALAPGAAMDEHHHRRARARGGVEVERLDRRGPVGEPGRRAEAGARNFAVDRRAAQHLVPVRRIDELIVGVVELLLVHVEPDPWPLGACRRRRGGALGRQRFGRTEHRCATAGREDRFAAHVVFRGEFSIGSAIFYSGSGRAWSHSNSVTETYHITERRRCPQNWLTKAREILGPASARLTRIKAAVRQFRHDFTAASRIPSRPRRGSKTARRRMQAHGTGLPVRHPRS